MAKEVATLFVELRGSFAKFSADMNQVSKTFSGLGKNVERIGKQFTSAFTVPLGLVGAAAIAAAKDMDEAFDTIRAKTGATGDALDSLQGTFKAVFVESTQGAKEVGNVIAELNTGLGLTGKPLAALSKQVTGLAQVTGQDLATTVKGTVSLFNSWQVATDKQSSTMDFLFKVGQKTNANVGELAQTVASFQPTLQRLGLGLEQSASMFALLGKNGLDAGNVMGAFNVAVTKFSKAGVKDMGAALQLTFNALKKAPSDTAAAAAAIEIFGNKAGPQLASLIRQGKLSVDDFIAGIQGSTETIGKAVDDTDSFSDRLTKFRHQVEVALEPLGSPILKGLTELMKELTPILKSAGEAFAGLSPAVREFIAGAGVILVVVGPVIKVVGFLFGWVARLGPVFRIAAQGGVLMAGSLTLLFTPLGVVAALVGAAIAVWYEWDTISPMIDHFAADVNVGLSEIGRIVTQVTDEALGSALAFAQGIGEAFVGMKDNVLASVQMMVEGVQEWFTGKFDGAKQAVVGFTDDVKATFEGLYDSVIGPSSVPDLVNGVGENFATLGAKMIPPTQAATAGVDQAFSSLLTSIKNTSKGAGDEGKKLGESWKRTGEDLKSVMSDLNHDMDPLRKNITELLKANDYDGLNKLAESFKGNKDALDQFRKSLSDGKGDFNEWNRNQTQLNEKLKDTQKELYELAAGKKLIDPLTESITQLMAAGDMEGLKNLGSSMQDTAEHSRAFDQALSGSMGTMKEMKAAGEELASSLTEGMSGMFKNFGVGGEYADMFGGILGGLTTGKGKGGFGQLGNLINGQMGTGDIFSSLLGGGGSSGGSGDIFGSIMSGLGLGSSGSGGGDLIGQALSGNLDKSMSLSSLGTGTSDLSSSLTGLSGGMSSMTGYLGIATDTLQSFSKIGKNTKSTFEGGGQIAGAGIGAVLGGPAGASIGSSIGKVVGSFLGGTLGGGPKNKDTIARKQVESFLEDAFKDKHTSFFGSDGKMQPFNGNFQFGSSDRFNNPGWADKQQQQYGPQSTQVFDSIGTGLTKVLGITQDVGGQIGAILQENLVGNIDNARLMMAQLGVSQQDMTDAFEKAGEEGSMSWHEVEVNLQGVSQAFGEGLVGVKNMKGGFDQIIQSGGDGMDAIQGIKNAAIEAGEASVTSFDEWKAALLQAGSDPAYVDAFFAALQSRGLTSLDAIKDATTRTLGGVIADMQSNSSALADVWTKAQTEAKKYLDTIKDIPDSSTKNVQLNVSASIDGNAKKVLDMQPNTSSPVNTNVPAFASGGIVTGPTLGLIGEAGPEAILPLGHLQGMLKVAAQGGSNGSGSNVYHIDARGASPGVEGDIMRAMAMMEDRAVEAAVLAVAQQRERGGTFAESF